MSTPDSGQPGPESSSPLPARTCPHCGAVLPVDAPEGQCPACLMQNLTLEPSPTSATQPAEAPRPPSPPLSPAEVAPHFPQLEILECLGRGGMGVVYKARQKSLNRLVALKLLAPEREKDAAFAERFTREAQALALLSHSHIVTVYDFGVTSPSSENAGDGFYYLLMEYVDGVNLRQLLDQRKLTAEEALAIVPPLCDALQFAHERGIVHRDIKPENLLLDRRGQVKIADFGIAKMMGNGTPSHAKETGESAGKAESPPAPLGVTQPQTALGTPAYMAPEQASAPERVDSRADIYSLGVVFYEMLTGELPAKQIETTSSRLKNLHIDVRVDEIVLRALEKKPEMRWQTAAEFRTRIEAVTTPPPLPPAPPPGVSHVSAPRPFRPWMQRFVAQPVEIRRLVFWGLMIAGMLLGALFMMPVQQVTSHADSGLWQQFCMHGVPDSWFVETLQQASGSMPSHSGADMSPLDAPVGNVRQLMREVRPLTVSYALGLLAAGVWAAFWSFFAAEQRAGDRLPVAQRAFAVPLVDRGREVRISWGRIVILLVAFLGTVAVLSGHMSAVMMLVIRDAPSPLFNAVLTTFILSFGLVRLLGQELAGVPAAPAVATPPGFGLTAVAAATVYAYILSFLVKIFELGHGSDRFALGVFLVTWGVSISIVHHLLARKRLSDDATRRWLRISSICGWIIALPMAGLAIFFLMAMFQEGFRWNPGAMEAVMVPLIGLGALLLPLAAWRLWRASGKIPSSTNRPRLRGWRLAFGLLLLVAALGIPLLGLMLYSLSQTRARVVYHQRKEILQQRVAIEQANLEDLLRSERELQNKYLRSQPSEATGLSHSLNDLRTIVAQTRDLVEKVKRDVDRLSPPAPAFGPPVPAIWIAGSVLCLVAAMVLFWTQVPSGAGYARFFLLALPVLAFGYAAVMLDQIFSSRSLALRPPVEVEVPFAYNWTARGNVLLVTLTTKVRGDHVEGRVVLRGKALENPAQAEALQTYQEPIAFPGWPDSGQPGKKFHRGTGEWQIAFALPDAEMAKEAGRNLRPMGLLTPGLGGAAGGVLFRISSQAHGVYQGEIHFGVAGNLMPESASESAIPEMSEPGFPVPKLPSSSPLRVPSEVHETQTIDPPIMDTSDSALRSLSRQEFDETPGQYWRQFAEVRRFREAAELIERYLALHPELEEAGRHVEGADLHFHAAQCHAFAGNKEKALEHLTRARHAVANSKDADLWNSYVEGTEAFLRGDRTKLVQTHSLLVRDPSQNRENLLVIERLLAGFGRSYADAYEWDADADHRKLSADSFNRAWELLDKPKRTAEEDAQMLAYSHASLAHWRMRSDVKPRNFSIAYWQLSRIYAVLGQGENAATYAHLCFSVSMEIPRQERPFYFAYANEAMARAARLRGDGRIYYPAMKQAKDMLQFIENSSERELVEKDLKELEDAPPREP